MCVGGVIRIFSKIYTPVARTNLARDEATASKENMEKKLEEMLEKLNRAKADLSNSKQGQDIHLTKKELDLLKLLFDNIDLPLTRDEILSQVWGDEVYVEERTVDNFISNIRKTLNLNEPHSYFIKTVRGVGYALMKMAG